MCVAVVVVAGYIYRRWRRARVVSKEPEREPLITVETPGALMAQGAAAATASPAQGTIVPSGATISVAPAGAAGNAAPTGAALVPPILVGTQTGTGAGGAVHLSWRGPRRRLAL